MLVWLNAAGDGEAWSPAYGGHSELVALSEALCVRLEIIDCSKGAEPAKEGGGGGVPTYRLGEALPPTAPAVYLLRRGLHYHMMVPAQAEGERVDAMSDVSD